MCIAWTRPLFDTPDTEADPLFSKQCTDARDAFVPEAKGMAAYLTSDQSTN